MRDIETRVLEWLKTGNDKAEDIVDLPWSIRKVGLDIYVAEHPRMPFSLLVTFSEEFIHLLVPLGLETFSMAKDEKLKVYHTLLRLNDQVNLMKFTLSGMDDDVYLRVDLDKKTLGKDEFNDALAALLVGLMSAVSALGLEEAFAKEIFDRIVGMVLERVERGASRDELMRFLTVKVGMSVEDAKNLLNEVFAAKKEIDEQGKDVGYF
ncbi:YbjN domain-containing protein [Thermococcus sp. 21S7]|uniref:YbjN domain-containing protein n=1 Tax=Thermococcus sp. 21S7 TaxID=1638221 RepID=UPI00143B3A63|nr:YbjN domain-containing protein [Thermococcus sp. 21S7]NJE61871.1 DNA-binding protein [Thermococcus sp. 21S7]